MFIVFIYLFTSSQRKNYCPNATGPLSICEAILQHDSFSCNLYQSSPARRDLAALCNHRTTTWLEESFSCGLSQWIRGLRWIACTCDVVGSNLAPVLSHPSHLSLCHSCCHCSAYSPRRQKQIPQLYICSRWSCDDEMFPPTQAGRQAVAPQTRAPQTRATSNCYVMEYMINSHDDHLIAIQSVDLYLCSDKLSSPWEQTTCHKTYKNTAS